MVFARGTFATNGGSTRSTFKEQPSL